MANESKERAAAFSELLRQRAAEPYAPGDTVAKYRAMALGAAHFKWGGLTRDVFDARSLYFAAERFGKWLGHAIEFSSQSGQEAGYIEVSELLESEL